MNERHHLQAWLELEAREGSSQAASDESVEQALGRVFAALPVLEPSPAFTQRVVLATRWAPIGSRWFGRPAVRAAVALCVVQVALLLGMLPAVLAAVSSSVGLPGAATTAVSTSVASLRWLAEAAAVSGAVGETLAGFAAHPTLLSVLFLCLLLSAAGLAALVQVGRYYRSTSAGGEA